MTGLIDLDSILYLSVYKVVSFSQIREAYNQLESKEQVRQWLMEQVYSEAINRCENELLKMQNHLSEIFFEEITSWELYITTCTKSFRKDISTKYKAKRKRNNYVWMIREHYKFNGAFFSETHEADDLIARRAVELGRDKCMVISIDKDLKQIGGWLWNYTKTYEVDGYGDRIVNEFGFYSRIFKNNEVEWITQKEANYFFWCQMLGGDSGDGITGIEAINQEKKLEIKKDYGILVHCRVGVKTAEKILYSSTNNFITVARQYILRDQKQGFKDNYKLLKLE
jgi:5'-3' exonuclease